MGNILNVSGYALMALSMFLYSVCEALEKYLTNTYEPSQIIFFRSVLGLIFALWIIYKKGLKVFKPDKLLHFLRTIFAAGALLLTIYSLKYLPLSSYGFMTFTSPIFISFFSYLFLKESLSSSIIISVFISFGGILLISYPFSNIGVNLGLTFAFLSSIFYATSCIITKRISHIDNFALYASYIVVCLFVSGIFSIDNMTLQIKDIPLFIFLAFIHFLAFQCLIFAYRKEDLVKLSTLEYSTVIWSILLGFIIWKYLPSSKEILGGIFIILGSILVKHKELKNSIINALNRLK